MSMMIGGCSDASEEALPPVPSALVASDEMPFGDAISARMTRAANLVRDTLEPQWGKLEGSFYLLPADQRDALERQIQTGLAGGWKREETHIRLDKAELRVFAGRKKLVAYLLLDAKAGAFYPVQVLHN